MGSYKGDFAEDATVRFYFSTNAGDGSAVDFSDALEAGDIKIYKNGGVAQKTSTNGVTVTSGFDSLVGITYVELDTSNDTGDAGFWVANADYAVILDPDTETVDSQDVTAVVAEFSIENRTTFPKADYPTNFSDTAIASGTGYVSADAVAISGDTTSADNLELDYDGTGYNKSNSTIGTVTAVASGGITAASIATDAIDADALAADAVAEINATVDTALSDIGLDHLLAASVSGADITDDSIIAQLVSSSATADWDDFDNTTESLQSIRDRGDAAWITEASPTILQETTIATLASQTSFTLTAGSSDNDAYNSAMVIVTDQSTSTQKAVGWVENYVGSTKTVTLKQDPGIFTMATGDSIAIVADVSLKPTTLHRSADVTANGTIGVDWGNVENQSTTVDLSATSISLTDTTTDVTNAVTVTGTPDVNVAQISGDSTAADNLESYCDGTTPQPVNVTQLSGDATAADNAESFFDGTGYDATANSINVTQIEGADATDQINAACDSAIETYGLDHLVSASVAGSDVADNSIVAKLVSDSSTADWDDFDNTTDSLVAQRKYQVINTGTAQAGGTSSITLAAGETTTDDFFNFGCSVWIISGTGAGQNRLVTDYNGTTKVATVDSPWATNPDNTSVYALMKAKADASSISASKTAADDVESNIGNLDQAISTTEGTITGTTFSADVVSISGDTTAADNLESYCDGTTPMPVNTTQISGDATAADNLESYCDGTTPQPVNVTQVSGDSTAADNIEADYDGTGYNKSASTIGTCSTVTAMAGTIQTLDALDTAQDTQHSTTQSSIAGLNDVSTADVTTSCTTSLNSYDPPTKAELDTAEANVLAKLLAYVQLLARKDSAIATDNATELNAINEDEGTGAGSYDNTTDSVEALQAEHDSTQTSISGLNDVSSADVNAACDTALSDYDPPTRTEATADKDAILTRLGTPSDTDVSTDVAAINTLVSALNDLSASQVNSEVVDALQTDTPVDGYSIVNALKIGLAVLAGKIADAGSGTETFKGLDGNTTRVTITVNTDGDRSAVTYNV